MSEITGQDEARRALATQIEASVFAFRLQGDDHMRIAMSFASWQQVIAALRAPSLDRGAEEMRDIIAAWHDDLALDRDRRASKIVVNTLGRDRLQYEATIHRDCARAVRSMPLPVPADLNEGGGK